MREVGLVSACAQLLLELQAVLAIEGFLLCFRLDCLLQSLVLPVELENLDTEETLLVLLFLDEVHELLNLVLDGDICAGISGHVLRQFVPESIELVHLFLDRSFELLDVDQI